jgi:hypothetical protein
MTGGAHPSAAASGRAWMLVATGLKDGWAATRWGNERTGWKARGPPADFTKRTDGTERKKGEGRKEKLLIFFVWKRFKQRIQLQHI